MITCPTCKRDHDVMTRQLGDRLWCVCGQWLLIVQTPGGWAAQAVSAPVSYPRRKRT